MNILSLLILVTVLWQTLAAPPMVETPLGKIEGVMSELCGEPVKMFLGIPFAKPPLGKLRFLRPEPMEPWSYVLQAKTHPPACMQYTKVPFPWYDDMPGKSENCLYLNIYTPFFAGKGSKFAVLFWIFGGGLTLGSNRLDVYDGRSLATKEGVVVVTINYRLGLFGFLTTNTDDAPGNQGFYDAVMALQWVNDNIEYFGGDKNRITLMGESAGSQAVSLMCVSPLTKGLFSRAIIESANIIRHKYSGLDANMALGERLAEAVNCAWKNFTIYDHPAEVVLCLRNRNATSLTKTLWSFHPYSMRSFAPQYGNDLLPNNALDDIRKGDFHNVPILIGVNKDEGSFYLANALGDEAGFFGEKDPKVNKTHAETLLKTAFKNYTDSQNYIDFYLKDIPDDNYDLIRIQVYTALGDQNIVCPTVYFAESYAERNNNVYYYFFTHRPSTTPWAKWMGVAHFEEVQFVFGRPSRIPMDYKAEEVWLSNQMMKIWSSFAKEGYPGVHLIWPKYSKATDTYFNINTNGFGRLGEGPHKKSCNLLRNYYGF